VYIQCTVCCVRYVCMSTSVSVAMSVSVLRLRLCVREGVCGVLSRCLPLASCAVSIDANDGPYCTIVCPKFSTANVCIWARFLKMDVKKMNVNPFWVKSWCNKQQKTELIWCDSNLSYEELIWWNLSQVSSKLLISFLILRILVDQFSISIYGGFRF
jgi:hypothetical protein